MTTELPEKPLRRTEQYLATIAGHSAGLPERPESRLEQYLAYIAGNGSVAPEGFFTDEGSSESSGSDTTIDNTIEAPLTIEKMNGDTFQDSISGDNLYNYKDTNSISGDTSADDEGYITQTADNSAGTGNVYANYFTHNLNLSTSTNYLVVCEIKSVTGSGTLFVVNNNAQSQSVDNVSYALSDLHVGDILVAQFKTKDSYTGDAGIRTVAQWRAGQAGSITYRISVLANTSITPETFVYQPYTGGVPSPNPLYPETINVVTGVQTITVSGQNLADGVSYTVDLGSVELCRIGGHQDFIYKNGEDWYLHKEIGKIVLDTTSSSWEYDKLANCYSIAKTNLSSLSLVNRNTDFCMDTFYASALEPTIIGQAFIGNSYFSVNYDGTSTSDGLATFQSWLTSNKPVLYAPLATVTDTKITDSTLKGELGALWGAKSYLGTTRIVVAPTGTNLPTILDVEAFNKNLNGILGAIGRLSE